MGVTFDPIRSVAEIMRGFPHPWFVSGGWAIDLFLQHVTRDHSDIEIGIYRRDQQAIHQHLPGWTLEKVVQIPDGGNWVPWEESEQLNLPVHQVRAKRLQPEPLEFEFFLNECNETHWMSRRHPELIRPMDEIMMMSFLGIPILAPEIQLLFKAKQTRPKDQNDFDLMLPFLNPAQRRWLADALKQYYPDHSWQISH